MRIVAVFTIFLGATQKCTEQIQKETYTLSVQERVALLKYQISENIKKKSFANEKLQPIEQHDVIGDSYEYEDLESKPITPINENDERKKHGRFRMRQLKTTTETLWVRPKTTRRKTTPMARVNTEQNTPKQVIQADDLPSSVEIKKPKKLKGLDDILEIPKKGKKIKTLRHVRRPVEKASNIFYRRIFAGDLKKHCAKETIHCQDLITPYLTGVKVNMTEVKRIKYTDHSVVRLVQLLGEDTSQMGKEEVYSLMYQISNIQIRLFQWEVTAIKLLLNVIHKEPAKRHSFASLKNGIKRLLTSWHVEYTANVTSLMQQARLFRPPCIQNDFKDGSTKASQATRYTTPKKRKCSDVSDGNSGSCEV